MTFLEGITLGIIGTTITLIGFAIAYSIGSGNKEKNDEEKQKERFKKICPGWH